MAKVKSTKINESAGDKILNGITAAILIAIIIIVGYPILYVIACSFTSTDALSAGLVVLWPVNTEGKFAISLEAYEFVMQYKAVWTGFRNSVFYTVCDVFLQMTMTILVAYPLSRSYFQGRSIYTMIFYMSTRVSAGLIPGFILKCDLGLFDNIWAVLISGSVSVSHILILRTCFKTAIPGELFDSAMIDGANHFQCVTKIALPLAKATLSVLILYCIVGQWNEYFTSMLYLRDARLYPLQLVLREILLANAVNNDTMAAAATDSGAGDKIPLAETVKYATIMVATLPVLMVYPFLQKYFVKGVMIGAIKG